MNIGLNMEGPPMTPEERQLKKLRAADAALNKVFVDHAADIQCPAEVVQAITAWRRAWYQTTGRELEVGDQALPPMPMQNAHSYQRKR